MCGSRRNWLLWTALGLLALFLGAHYYGWMGQGLGFGWGMGPGYGRGGWSMGFMGLPMILFWVLVVAVIWGLASGASGVSGDRSAPPAPDALDPALSILSQRFAKGELTREEYLSMRKDLQTR